MTSILAATWTDGMFGLAAGSCDHEFAGQSVRGLAVDGERGILAIVDNHSLVRRSAAGEWRQVASDERELSCCLAVGGKV